MHFYGYLLFRNCQNFIWTIHCFWRSQKTYTISPGWSIYSVDSVILEQWAHWIPSSSVLVVISERADATAGIHSYNECGSTWNAGNVGTTQKTVEDWTRHSGPILSFILLITYRSATYICTRQGTRIEWLKTFSREVHCNVPLEYLTCVINALISMFVPCSFVHFFHCFEINIDPEFVSRVLEYPTRQ